ncbi:Spb1 C-terminal domain-containing protein [Umbelopsis sp. AD052]|nr:Spb1 C-terminal domain-containing protein [Umbelopsis sp. AD052]
MPQKRDKKSSKGRLDKYYYLAKEQGYRARSAFKLVQLNKKYGFLEKSRVLIDLCAAPGADVVLHDGAPNVGTAWTQDAFSQSELVLMSLKLATEFLNKGGTFVTKVFRSKDYNNLIWVFQQLFRKVEATKPPSSRNVSAEIFVVCQDYIAPKKLDPRFLDAKAVFAELEQEEKSKQVDIFHPEKRKRHREGYEDGNYTMHKKVDIMEFITAQDPILVLGSYNQFVFESDESKVLLKHDSTTEDIKINVEDLKVLGKKDFKQLLKWRSSIREERKMDSKAEKAKVETAEVEPVDDDEIIEAELANLTKEEAGRVKRARRKANEKRAKTLQRMQLNMVVPADIGMEQEGPSGHQSLFGLSKISKAGALQEVIKGDMTAVDNLESFDDDMDYHVDSVQTKIRDPDEYVDSDDGDFELEEQLEAMYENYIERQSERDAKYKVKKMRAKENEWKGFDANKDSDDEDEGMDSETGERRKDKDDDFSDDSDSESDEEPIPTLPKKKSKNPLLVDLSNEEAEMKMITKTGLTKKAAMFFDQDAFKGIEGIDLDGDDDDDEEEEEEDEDMAELDEESEQEAQTVPSLNGKKRKAEEPLEEDDEESDFEIVAGAPEDDLSQDEAWDGKEDKKSKDVRKAQEIGLITAEAMTLARQLANKEKTKQDLIDEGFTKEAFRDKRALPQWFLDDEDRHNQVNIPVTKEAIQAVREKLKALDARPIKKIAEAKARKKFKANQRLEKAKKKATDIADNQDMSEKEKATSIGKLLQRATKARPKKEVKVVVAKGSNRGVQGRPKGVKGRYKMVDSRMKKETRALKRIAKKNKKNGGRKK